jgi:PPOX class probable F420-dependent enzyme
MSGMAPMSAVAGRLSCRAGRAIMDYVPDSSLTWREASSRLAAARNYWLDTTTPSGAPHAAPVWGVVVDHTLYLYSERGTVKARNLAADPRVVVHLEDAEDVLIVRGVAEDLGTPSEVPHVVSALAAKYSAPGDQQYLPDADPDFDVVYAIRPRSALVWRLADYAATQRRWSIRS